MNLWNVVLAGGTGSRFWPMSTTDSPKQLLPLVTNEAMIVDTLKRIAPIAPPEQTLILSNASLVDAIRNLAPDIPADNIIAEPRPAGTCAALVWAANIIAQKSSKDSVMISVHADWAVADTETFRSTLQLAAQAAYEHNSLVTVGIVPTRPETGFGYIKPGEKSSEDSFYVERFIEKPDISRAKLLIDDGCLWNSGIFAWRAGDLIDEVMRITPEVSGSLKKNANNADSFFAEVEAIAIDTGVLERSNRVLVVPGNFGWDDVGTWAALHRVREHDASGNAVYGRVHALESSGNVVHSTTAPVVLYGVDDLVVVAVNDVIMVTTKEKAADLKHLLSSIPNDIGPQ